MILVTGATGLLGSHVLYELAIAGKPVRAIFRDEESIEKTKTVFGFYNRDVSGLFRKIEWVRADISDFFALNEALQDVTQVYHTAGLVSFNDSDKRQMNRVNIDGTANIVNACLEAGNISLCHVSSVATLGELENGDPVTEDIIWNRGKAASAYAISKHKGEMEVWRGINEGLAAVIVNPSVIIGPGMWMGPGKELFYRVSKGLRYYPDGATGYIDVRDVARAMIMLAEKRIYGERFILNAANMSIKEFLDLLSAKFGKPGPDRRVSDFIARSVVTAECLRSVVTMRPPRITIRTLRIASEKLTYSNARIRKNVDISFTPVEVSLNDAIRLFNR